MVRVMVERSLVGRRFFVGAGDEGRPGEQRKKRKKKAT